MFSEYKISNSQPFDQIMTLPAVFISIFFGDKDHWKL